MTHLDSLEMCFALAWSLEWLCSLLCPFSLLSRFSFFAFFYFYYSNRCFLSFWMCCTILIHSASSCAFKTSFFFKTPKLADALELWLDASCKLIYTSSIWPIPLMLGGSIPSNSILELFFTISWFISFSYFCI